MSFQVVEIDPHDDGGNRVLCTDGRFRSAASNPTVFVFPDDADGIAEGLKASNRNSTLNLAVLPYLDAPTSTAPSEATPAPASAHRFWSPPDLG